MEEAAQVRRTACRVDGRVTIVTDRLVSKMVYKQSEDRGEVLCAVSVCGEDLS